MANYKSNIKSPIQLIIITALTLFLYISQIHAEELTIFQVDLSPSVERDKYPVKFSAGYGWWMPGIMSYGFQFGYHFGNSFLIGFEYLGINPNSYLAASFRMDDGSGTFRNSESFDMKLKSTQWFIRIYPFSAGFYLQGGQVERNANFKIYDEFNLIYNTYGVTNNSVFTTFDPPRYLVEVELSKNATDYGIGWHFENSFVFSDKGVFYDFYAGSVSGESPTISRSEIVNNPYSVINADDFEKQMTWLQEKLDKDLKSYVYFSISIGISY